MVATMAAVVSGHIGTVAAPRALLVQLACDNRNRWNDWEELAGRLFVLAREEPEVDQ
jgi:L-serine deaminase